MTAPLDLEDQKRRLAMVEERDPHAPWPSPAGVAALVGEVERLRATPSVMDWARIEGERDEARAEVERLTKERGQMVETIRTARQALKNGSHDAAFAILDSSLDAEPEPAPQVG